MKLSYKIILIFSIMMIASASLLTFNSTRSSLRDSNAFMRVRFRNMGSTMAKSIEQEISMMELAIDELTSNTSFMAVVNQLVRDDSDDRKMANTARKIILNQFYRSPLVDHFYRVSFYTREGLFVTNRFEKDDYLQSDTEQARQILSSLPWLDIADARPNQYHILPKHNDCFSVRRDIAVYGIVRAVTFNEKVIGYIEISNEYSQLKDIMTLVDEDTLVTQAVFDNGTVLYSSAETPVRYPAGMEPGVMADWADETGDIRQKVWTTRVEWLNLSIYIAQDYSVVQERNRAILSGNAHTTVAIMVPTLLLIVAVSMGLTHSIRCLMKKLRRLPVDDVQRYEETSPQALAETVTTASAGEVHELEHVFNSMMQRLHESTMNELSTREGTLQAQLSALQAQINPHFVYNTLNIISAKSMESGNFEIIEICDQFAQMLRYSTDTRSRTATMAEEIENARNYLLLAKARYEENLEFSIDIPEHLETLELPKLSLQPIVENALNHGYNGQNIKRRLSITGCIHDGHLMLEIRDNGTGFSADVLENLQSRIREIESGSASLSTVGGHIGLLNTCLRLYYYSKGAMHISIHNDGGAVVCLTLPYTASPEQA